MTPLLPLALLAIDTLVVGTVADPVSLDPHQATDLVSAAIIVNTNEPLVRYRTDGSRPEPALAMTWATVDSRTWTFTLRPGVVFHDGTPLDADAVVANLENLRRVRGFVGRAERMGPLVFTITLDRPNAALLATLSQPFFTLQSPRELASPSGRPVGTGPYRLVSQRAGEIELAGDSQYWGGAPRIKRVVFRRFPSEDSLIQGLLAGEVDLTSSVGQDRVDRLREHPEIVLHAETGLNIAFLSINNERRPLGDPRVRHAIARTIDREALVSQILGGHGEPARNPLPPSFWAYSTRTSELILDRPLARRLLAEAGYSQGFETTLMAVDTPRLYMPAPLRLASLLREDLAQVGIRARLRQVPSWAEYVDRATRGDYDLGVLGWQADTMDPNDFLVALLASESIGTTNRSRYRSPAMDALLKQGRRGSASPERLISYREAQVLFQRDMPWVPLYHVGVYTVHRQAVRGLTVGPTGLLRLDKVTKQE
jgi:ABC-type transport system substrate-binding protein